MKSRHVKKSSNSRKQEVAILAAKAIEADKQAETARKVARLAKTRYKEARKAHKHAKKVAKQARKNAKAAAKALRNQVTRNQSKRATKARKKPAAAVAPLKPALRHVADHTTQTHKTKRLPVSPPSVTESGATTENGGPNIAQA